MKRNRLFGLASSALICACALFSCGESKLYSCWGKTYSYQDGYATPWMENSPFNPAYWNDFVNEFTNKNIDFAGKFTGSTIDEFKTYCVTEIVNPAFQSLKEYTFEFKSEGDNKQVVAKKGSVETVFTCSGEMDANPQGTIKQYSLIDSKGVLFGTLRDGYYEDSNMKGIAVSVNGADNVLGIATETSISFDKKSGGTLNPLSFVSFLNEVKA